MKNMWEVLEHGRVSGKLHRMPLEILKRYEKWKDIVRISGPLGPQLIRGFRDEMLRRKWQGHRSSRLGKEYCIIYRVVAQKILVEVIDLTAHDYRKRNV